MRRIGGRAGWGIGRGFFLGKFAYLVPFLNVK
jgi:hypothetical protein